MSNNSAHDRKDPALNYHNPLNPTRILKHVLNKVYNQSDAEEEFMATVCIIHDYDDIEDYEIRKNGKNLFLFDDDNSQVRVYNRSSIGIWIKSIDILILSKNGGEIVKLCEYGNHNKTWNVGADGSTYCGDRLLHYMSPSGIEDLYVVGSRANGEYIALDTCYYLHTKRVTKDKYTKALRSYIIKISGLLPCLTDLIVRYYF